MSTTQQEGKLFENKVRDLFEKFGFKCLGEREIMKLYGNKVTAFDHMLYHENKIILLQEQCRIPPNLLEINHFNSCFRAVKDQSGGKHVSAIYVTSIEPSRLAKNALTANVLTINDKIKLVHDSNMDELIKKLESEVLLLLNASD